MTRRVSFGGFVFALGGVAFCSLAIGAGAVTLLARGKNDMPVPVPGQVGSTQETTKALAHPALTVSLVHPGTAPFDETVEVLALVSPKTLASVHFLLPGKVEACGVKVGDAVDAGAPLCRLDTTVMALEQSRAQAAVANADRALDSTFLQRQKALYESGVIGQGDYERVRIEAEKAASLRDDARTALALAEKKMQLHSLRAPFRGRVVDVRARAGLPISPEVPAVVLSSWEGLVLKAEIPARHWARVNPGNLLTLSSVAAVALPSTQGAPAAPRFTVVSKAPSVAAQKQTFEVELAPVGEKSSVSLAPGMLVSGRLALARFEKGRTLPLEAFFSWDSATGAGEVFVRERASGRAKLTKVTTTPPSAGLVQVLSGLTEDAAVVSPVPPNLLENDAVEEAQ